MRTRLCLLIRSQFPTQRWSGFTFPNTRVCSPRPPFFLPFRFPAFWPLFFHFYNLSHRNLTLDFRFTLITALRPPPFPSPSLFYVVFLLFFYHSLSSSRLSRDCRMLLFHPLPNCLLRNVVKKKKNSFVKLVSPIVAFILSIGLLSDLCRILASYYLRGDVKVN